MGKSVACVSGKEKTLTYFEIPGKRPLHSIRESNQMLEFCLLLEESLTWLLPCFTHTVNSRVARTSEMLEDLNLKHHRRDGLSTRIDNKEVQHR
jgi:hypothetical protein